MKRYYYKIVREEGSWSCIEILFLDMYLIKLDFHEASGLQTPLSNKLKTELLRIM